jgi:uncharacterized membrane protein
VRPGKQKISPIVQAIAKAERGTTGEIRVHLTRRWFEKDPLLHAMRVFEDYGMARTSARNAVLIYVNMRARKLAILGDEGIHRAVGSSYWIELANELKSDLLSTYYENAIAIAVLTVGATLKQHFPK